MYRGLYEKLVRNLMQFASVSIRAFSCLLVDGCVGWPTHRRIDALHIYTLQLTKDNGRWKMMVNDGQWLYN